MSAHHALCGSPLKPAGIAFLCHHLTSVQETYSQPSTLYLEPHPSTAPSLLQLKFCSPSVIPAALCLVFLPFPPLTKTQTGPRSLWCPRPPTELEQHSSDPRLPRGLNPHPDKPSTVQASLYCIHTQLCGYCPLTPGCRISLPPPIPTLHPQSEVTSTAL